MTKVTRRAQMIGVGLYSLPFLAVIGFSFIFVWAGNLEMVVAVAALLPAALYFFGVHWCRYIVGTISALCFVAATLRAIPALSANQGRYFWLIWTPIWLLFGLTTLLSFLPIRQSPAGKNS